MWMFLTNWFRADIAGLEKAKELLNEAVILPTVIPEYFKVTQYDMLSVSLFMNY